LTTTNPVTTDVGGARIDWTRDLGTRIAPDRTANVPGTGRAEDANGNESATIAMHTQEVAVGHQVIRIKIA